MKQILTDSIRIDGETQSRVQIDQDAVQEYADAMAGGTAFPPVTVFFDGTDYWCADGFHRVLAALRAGVKHLAAEVKRGGRAEAAWAACGANLTHGIRRTNADKRKAVTLALRMHPEMSDSALAAHCGVRHPYVAEVRRQVVTVTTCPPPPTRTGRDGKQYPAPPQRPLPSRFGPPPAGRGLAGNPPPAARTPPGRGPGEEAGGRTPEARSRTPEARSRTPEARSRTPEAGGRKAEAGGRKAGGSGPVDDMGRRLPERVVPLWERCEEVQGMLTALSRIRVALKEAQSLRDPLFGEVPYSATLAHLDQAYSGVQVARPYVVCPFCQGHGCRACKDRGLISKHRLDATVPRELKEQVAKLIEEERRGAAE